MVANGHNGVVAPAQRSRIPWGQTARRLDWVFLPPHIRGAIEHRIGSSVVEAASQDAGFTPGFASILTGADGSKTFVKAASIVAQRTFADAYREEARKLGALPQGAPVPRLLWTFEDDWVVLGIEYVDGALPTRPWQTTQLNRCLDTLEACATALTPPPVGLVLDTMEHELADFPNAWEVLRTSLPDLAHLEEAAELALQMPRVIGGATLVHTDVRDDNLLLGMGGEGWLCDWNWPAVGADWIDTVCLLIQAFGDGIDCEQIIAERALTRDVPREHIDVLLAVIAGYFFRQRALPVPATSPWLRAHQSWMAEATWAWLSQRRDWT
jgi:aminoglycoside phosphotransferase (APT) family kinase protein